jgi:hypothetical protein
MAGYPDIVTPSAISNNKKAGICRLFVIPSGLISPLSEIA